MDLQCTGIAYSMLKHMGHVLLTAQTIGFASLQ
jgi:hypothetical protein